jgi:hypothetical protein
MRIAMIAAPWVATATAALPLAAVANADDAVYKFQSPSGNIICSMGSANNDAAAGCEIHDYFYVPLPKPQDCHLAWGDDFDLDQGTPARFGCHGGVEAVPPLATLGYGQMHSAGPITCDSEESGITCTDFSTGHFFQVSRGSYQLG